MIEHNHQWAALVVPILRSAGNNNNVILIKRKTLVAQEQILLFHQQFLSIQRFDCSAHVFLSLSLS